MRKLVICGVTTDVCVHSTMREGNDRGYECLLVEDAAGTAVEELHPAAVKMVQHSGGIFGATATTDSVLAGLGRAASSELCSARDATERCRLKSRM